MAAPVEVDIEEAAHTIEEDHWELNQLSWNSIGSFQGGLSPAYRDLNQLSWGSQSSQGAKGGGAAFRDLNQLSAASQRSSTSTAPSFAELSLRMAPDPRHGASAGKQVVVFPEDERTSAEKSPTAPDQADAARDDTYLEMNQLSRDSRCSVQGGRTPSHRDLNQLSWGSQSSMGVGGGRTPSHRDLNQLSWGSQSSLGVGGSLTHHELNQLSVTSIRSSASTVASVADLSLRMVMGSNPKTTAAKKEVSSNLDWAPKSCASSPNLDLNQLSWGSQSGVGGGGNAGLSDLSQLFSTFASPTVSLGELPVLEEGTTITEPDCTQAANSVDEVYSGLTHVSKDSLGGLFAKDDEPNRDLSKLTTIRSESGSTSATDDDLDTPPYCRHRGQSQASFRQSSDETWSKEGSIADRSEEQQPEVARQVSSPVKAPGLATQLGSNLIASISTGMFVSLMVVPLDLALVRAASPGSPPIFVLLAGICWQYVTQPWSLLPAFFWLWLLFSATFLASSVARTLCAAVKFNDVVPVWICTTVANSSVAYAKDAFLLGAAHGPPREAILVWMVRDLIFSLSAFALPVPMARALSRRWGGNGTFGTMKLEDVAQIVVPLVMQFLCTPLQYLGLTFVTHPVHLSLGWTERLNLALKEYLPRVGTRCLRNLLPYSFAPLVQRRVTSFIESTRSTSADPPAPRTRRRSTAGLAVAAGMAAASLLVGLRLAGGA